MEILLVILFIFFIIGGSSGDDGDEHCRNCAHYSRFFGKCTFKDEPVEDDDTCWAFEHK